MQIRLDPLCPARRRRRQRLSSRHLACCAGDAWAPSITGVERGGDLGSGSALENVSLPQRTMGIERLQGPGCGVAARSFGWTAEQVFESHDFIGQMEQALVQIEYTFKSRVTRYPGGIVVLS